MTDLATSAQATLAQRSLAECNAIMTEAGTLLELEERVVKGQLYKVYKNQPASVS